MTKIAGPGASASLRGEALKYPVDATRVAFGAAAPKLPPCICRLFSMIPCFHRRRGLHAELYILSYQSLVLLLGDHGPEPY